MTRYDMMHKISETLAAGEEITVNVAHCGRWSGADIYTIKAGGKISYSGHAWHTCGTLRDTYAARVLGK